MLCICVDLKPCTVFKQMLRSGGGNITPEHIIEYVSVCAFFLMEASKKADKVFNVPPAATTHTVHDSKKDMQKVSHLHAAKVTVLDKDRTTQPFIDPVETGWQKLAMTDWLKNTLTRTWLMTVQTCKKTQIQIWAQIKRPWFWIRTCWCSVTCVWPPVLLLQQTYMHVQCN